MELHTIQSTDYVTEPYTSGNRSTKTCPLKCKT